MVSDKALAENASAPLAQDASKAARPVVGLSSKARPAKRPQISVAAIPMSAKKRKALEEGWRHIPRAPPPPPPPPPKNTMKNDDNAKQKNGRRWARGGGWWQWHDEENPQDAAGWCDGDDNKKDEAAWWRDGDKNDNKKEAAAWWCDDDKHAAWAYQDKKEKAAWWCDDDKNDNNTDAAAWWCDGDKNAAWAGQDKKGKAAWWFDDDKNDEAWWGSHDEPAQKANKWADYEVDDDDAMEIDEHGPAPLRPKSPSCSPPPQRRSSQSNIGWYINGKGVEKYRGTKKRGGVKQKQIDEEHKEEKRAWGKKIMRRTKKRSSHGIESKSRMRPQPRRNRFI